MIFCCYYLYLQTKSDRIFSEIPTKSPLHNFRATNLTRHVQAGTPCASLTRDGAARQEKQKPIDADEISRHNNFPNNSPALFMLSFSPSNGFITEGIYSFSSSGSIN